MDETAAQLMVAEPDVTPGGPGCSRWPILICVLAIMGGIILRWIQLGSASLWFDEGYTAWAASLSPGQIVHVIRADTAPPLYYLMLRGWVALFGHSEVAMRAPSAICATASLLIFLPLARRILREPWAVAMAVCVFAASEMQIAFAHEARFYTLMALLAQVDLLLVLLAIEGRSPWKYAALILAWSASLYINNMMVVYLASLAVAWLILPGARQLRSRAVDILIVSAISGIIFVPWLPAMLAQSHAIHGNFWAAIPDWPDLWRTLSTVSGVNVPNTGPVLPATMAFLLLAMVLSGALIWRTSRMMIALAVFGLVPIFLVFVYSRVAQSIFMERAFIASTFVIPLLITLPLINLRQPIRGWAMGLVIIIWLIPGISSVPHNYLGEHREDWREAVDWAQQRKSPEQCVVFVANEGEMLYDYYTATPYGPNPRQIGVPGGFFELDPPHTMRRLSPDDPMNDLHDRLTAGGFDQIIFFQSHYQWADPQQRTLGLLESHLLQADHEQFQGVDVYRFLPV
jgi:mannosyltransferase